MINVYTQPDCRACKRVMGKLEEAGIRFGAVDVSLDDDARDYVVSELGAKSTPVVLDTETGEYIAGYQPDLLRIFIKERLDNE